MAGAKRSEQIGCGLFITFSILALFSFVASAGRPQYSVGVDMSLDYAAASIHFPNRTTVDIARIQGNAAYRQTMREAISSYLQDPDSAYSVLYDRAEHHISPVPYELRPWLDYGKQFLCHHFPPWVSGKAASPNLDPTAEAFIPILHTLKLAAETYLGGIPNSVHNLGISFPLPLTPKYRTTVHAAAASLGLELFEPRTAGIPAGQYAAEEFGAEGFCDDVWEHVHEPEQVILAVQSSQAALTVLLFREECGLYHTIRTLHNETLGVDACGASEECRVGLRQALTELTRVPPANDSFRVDQVVVHGESAMDPRLIGVLQELFPGSMNSSNGHSEPVNPLFAAARGLAKFGMMVIDEPPLDGCNCNDYTSRWC